MRDVRIDAFDTHSFLLHFIFAKSPVFQISSEAGTSLAVENGQ